MQYNFYYVWFRFYPPTFTDLNKLIMKVNYKYQAEINRKIKNSIAPVLVH